MNRWLRFLPLLVLAAFVAAVIWRLDRPAEEQIPSQLVGQPVPSFALAPAMPPNVRVDRPRRQTEAQRSDAGKWSGRTRC